MKIPPEVAAKMSCYSDEQKKALLPPKKARKIGKAERIRRHFQVVQLLKRLDK